MNDDPILRLAILHGWGESIRAGHPFISMVQEAAAKIDIPKYSTGSPTNAQEMAALFKRLEPHFQTEYGGLLDKMQINEEVAEAFENYCAGDVLENYLIRYVGEYGYSYSPDRRTFEPRTQK